MDIRQLRYFVSIVEEGTISAAAVKLRIAQPALSHHVRSLEADLGVQLLSRSAHGVRTTDAGQRLYEHAQYILRYIGQSIEEVRGYAAEPHGLVAVGLPTSVSVVLSVPLVEMMRQKLQHVRLRLTEGMSGDIRDWLDSGRLDFALLFDAERLRTLNTEPLLTEDLYVVSPPGGRGDDITLADVAELDLILPSRPHGLRERLEHAARSAGVTLKISAEVDSLPQLKALVTRGVASTVLSLSAVRDEWRTRAVEARLIVEPTLRRTVSLCHPKGRPLSGAASAVRALVREVLRNLVAQQTWPGKLLV
jgi:LysR family transcriptional regulator, nitrogen assimilation regulatory protein